MFTNRTLLPEDTKRKKTKKNDRQENHQITGIIATPSSDVSSTSTPASGDYCSGDQCSLSAHRASLNAQPTETMTPNTLFGQQSPFDAADKMDNQETAL